MEHPHDANDPPSGGSLSLAPVVAWLERSRGYGFLGPGPVAPHVEHALGFAAAVGAAPERFVDLGSGGGVPGLVLAGWWAPTEAVLLDSNERRTAFLEEAVVALGWQARVRVLRARAEEAGRDPSLRGGVPMVVSRSFGPPAVTAECAAPLLAVGGRLVVSEPPVQDGGVAVANRWPVTGLATLGMALGPVVQGEAGRYQVITQASACPDRFPRRTGVPGKRPLW